MRDAPPSEVTPCPYCAAPVEGVCETCTSCDRVLPPIPQLEPPRPTHGTQPAIYLLSSAVCWVSVPFGVLMLAQVVENATHGRQMTTEPILFFLACAFVAIVSWHFYNRYKPKS